MPGRHELLIFVLSILVQGMDITSLGFLKIAFLVITLVVKGKQVLLKRKRSLGRDLLKRTIPLCNLDERVKQCL